MTVTIIFTWIIRHNPHCQLVYFTLQKGILICLDIAVTKYSLFQLKRNDCLGTRSLSRNGNIGQIDRSPNQTDKALDSIQDSTLFSLNLQDGVFFNFV